MRNGFPVWDSDTHYNPTIETMSAYFDPEFREKLPLLEQYKVKGREGREDPNRHHYTVGKVAYKRILGEAGPAATAVVNAGKRMGTRAPASGVEDDLVDLRIADMDEEGVDVHMMVPGVLMNVSMLGDPSFEVGIMRAYHRAANDFCSKYPHRLKALMIVTGNDVEASVAEIKRWGSSSWAVGVWPFPGMERPLDHPDMEPIWAAANEQGLAIMSHSVAWDPPYYPGYRDVWDNLFLGRLSSHPWGGMRAVASFLGAGILDRYSDLKFGVLESGCGWLPFWMRRMEEHVLYVGTTAPLKHTMEEYMTGGRFFASMEMHEGEDMVKMVTSFLGDGVLMYASDYPHPECKFPDSVDHVLAWNSFDEPAMRKLMWENAIRCYGEP